MTKSIMSLFPRHASTEKLSLHLHTDRRAIRGGSGRLEVGLVDAGCVVVLLYEERFKGDHKGNETTPFSVPLFKSQR